jgi:hypothetical protein
MWVGGAAALIVLLFVGCSVWARELTVDSIRPSLLQLESGGKRPRCTSQIRAEGRAY